MPLAGEIIRASDVNCPACRVTRTAVQGIPDAGTPTAVAFTSERFDNDGMHDNATNNSRITFISAGIYVVGFHGMLAAAGDYVRAFCIIRLNGATELCRSTAAVAATATPQMDVSTVDSFAAGDYVEALVFQDNAANAARNLEQTDRRSPEFYAARIGELA
jgi:hypothetical protein